jgi:alanine racemase
VAIAHHAARCGVAAFGVGSSAEALELRKAGVTLPILVLGTIVDDESSDCIAHDVQIGIHALDRCHKLEREAKRMRRRARVHLKLDTGMSRLGVRPEKALELLRQIKSSPHLALEGVMTHMAGGRGALEPSTHKQLESFELVLTQARAAGLLAGWVHVANSACIFTDLRPGYDAVRPGIAAYGVLPAGLPGGDELEPVLTLRARVVYLKDIPAGTAVGYDGTWIASKRTRVATLPVGYNDGLFWKLSNRGVVLVRGRRAPIIGRISMDYTTVDVSDVPGCRVGDLATIVGSDGDASITVQDVAKAADTIPYEVTCAIGKRVSRLYRGGDVGGSAPGKLLPEVEIQPAPRRGVPAPMTGDLAVDAAETGTRRAEP